MFLAFDSICFTAMNLPLSQVTAPGRYKMSESSSTSGCKIGSNSFETGGLAHAVRGPGRGRP